MKARKIFLSGFLVLTTIFVSYSQENNANLLAIYSQGEIDAMTVSRPQFVTLLRNYAENGIELFESNDPKFLHSVEQLSEIPLRSKSGEKISIEAFLLDYNSGSFNALNYGFFSKQSTQVFHLVGTNQNILVVSTDKILQ